MAPYFTLIILLKFEYKNCKSLFSFLVRNQTFVEKIKEYGKVYRKKINKQVPQKGFVQLPKTTPIQQIKI